MAQFLVNQNDGCRLWFINQRGLNCTDMVSGGEGMTTASRNSRSAESKIQPPFMICKSKNRNFASFGVPGTFFAFHIVPDNECGWIRRCSTIGWRSQGYRPGSFKKPIYFLDNCGSDNNTPANVQSLKN